MLRLRALAKPGRTGTLLLVATSLAIVLTVTLLVVIGGHRALRHAALSAATAAQLPFTLRTVDVTATHSAGFSPVASTQQYTSGTFLAGSLYLAGPDGLSRIGSDGSATLDLRSGFELPTSPITAIATGKLRNASEPQLFLATAGAGLLILQPNTRTLQNLLPSNADASELTSVLPLPTGDLLLGTRHSGLLLYNGNRLVRQPLAVPGIDSTKLQITALAAINAASYVVGTRTSGVFLVRGGTVHQATTVNGLPDDEVESIAVADGHAFVGTPTGTADFNLSSSVWAPARTLAAGVFSHTLAADAHRLMIGTIDQGVQEVPLDQRATLRRVAIASGHPSPSLQRIDAFLPINGDVYALGDGKFLRHDNSDWTPVFPANPSSLTDRNISALAFAPDGTLYVGFFDHGIDQLSPQGVIHHLEDDHLFCINRLALDPVRHTIVAATGDGLVLLDAQGTPRQTLMKRDGLISDHITDIAFTPAGMAIATPAGITFLGPAGPESLYAFQGLVNNHVYALASSTGSNPDELLAGTLGGLSILRAKSVQRSFTVNNSTLGHNWITALLPMPQSNTLIGTYGAGLESLDTQGHFSSIDLPSGKSRDLVINPNALFATSTHIYAGTLGHGMLAYSQATKRWSALTAGLPSLNVTSFAAHDGELYVGTDNGLVRIAEANLP